ncbi:DUF2785 domain-containing protein [Ktedonosporobacter rubrisoli]|uniref:DUF2785 domain-containing protein n=1 Tax=Ktedonosporobacter rubrisoli TaxID=2509675 RepID=A0A4P6JKJ9_KTERU|nr:DUF2785 domain-containing protein [Ktedonosporobacter rubrisoli]QBD75698.1 DUF2785 domain-containing protein [Ktedonosporobacter rubrisoli]
MVPDILGQVSSKTWLQAYVQNGYQLPVDIEPLLFCKALLPNLGSPDPELRDKLTYTIMSQLILDQHLLTVPQLEELLTICLDREHLFYGIGKQGTDSVFMRSFSVLIVAAILYYDRDAHALSEVVTRQAAGALLRYVQEERDWRGYVEGKGWIHTAAHVADALDEIGQSRYASEQDCEAVMEAIRMLACLPGPFQDAEDDRQAIAAYGIIARKLISEIFVQRWLTSLILPHTSHDVVTYHRQNNARNMLRSLYFLLLKNDIAPEVRELISGAIVQIAGW